MADTQQPMEGQHPAMAPGGDQGLSGKEKKMARRYTLVPFPKIVFFYPLMFISMACGIMQIFSNPEANHVAGALFLIVFLINILVISFDFPGIKALALALGILAIVFGMILFNLKVYAIFGPLGEVTRALYHRVGASHTFYFVISGILFVMIMGGILGNILWNKWTIEPNRLKHKDGLFSVREYPVIDLQVNKEVDDIFEYILLLSGTLTFRIPNNPSFRLENVPFIARAERRIQYIVRKFSVSEK